MEWAPAVSGLQCFECGRELAEFSSQCPACNALLAVAFDPELIATTVTESGYSRSGIAPFANDHAVRRAVGGTPLNESSWLREELGVAAAYIKDEGRNPTGHISDRDMSAVAASIDDPSTILSLPSPGRSGIAAAGAAAAAGFKSQVFVPGRAPFGAKALINVHGGQMSVVPGRYADAKSTFEQATEDNWLDCRPGQNPIARAGRLSSYFEILADLDWQSPDVLVLPVGSGGTVLAFAQAARAAVEAGLVDDMPRFVLAQPIGCAPIVRAVANPERPEPWSEPDTICGELEIPDPVILNDVRNRLQSIDTTGVTVPDPATLEAAVEMAQNDGLQVSVAGGVAAAAATDYSPAASETVVVLNPGTATIDADVLRSHLMGQGI